MKYRQIFLLHTGMPIVKSPENSKCLLAYRANLVEVENEKSTWEKFCFFINYSRTYIHSKNTIVFEEKIVLHTQNLYISID